MTAPATYTVRPDSGPVTFSAPPGSILSSGITYWVKFEIAADSTFFTEGESIVVEYATDNNEVQGPTTYNRWSIGDDSLWSPETPSWTLEVKSIKMSVLGAPHYDTLVSNIEQPTLPLTLFVGPGYESAQSFRIPSGPLGQQYGLSSVRIIASSENPTHASVDLHADHNGTPGSHLASLTTPGDFAPGLSVKADFIAVAPRGTLLNTDTRYWIVFRNEQNLAYFDMQTTLSKTEDLPSLDGWTIGNRKVSKFPNQPWAESTHPIKMEILGSAPFIRTDEADGPDLPGAGHNAHKTGAVVTPGIVSTGHLTAGLDRNHGLYGDYWWLDTQWGHSYRIEVEFGDSQNNDTGGSAWMSFIDPDHDDYPYASGCCEADHNRDDGHTFVHFYRPTDDWNNRYLVHIAAFDKLNHNSRIYNGPYTITMTDITGTEKVATNLYLGTKTTSDITISSGTIEFAVSFTTGDHSDGYKLDRVRIHVPDHEGQPDLVLHANTSGVPGGAICDLLDPNKVQHHRPYAVNPLSVTFLAIDCSDEVLAANTMYWIVLEGADYEPVFTASDDQQTRGSGWTIGDRAALSLLDSWEIPPGDIGTIPVEIWATTDLSRTRPDVPSVTVSFEQGTYTVAEGGTVEVTVTLDPDPERTVTVPLTVTDQDGASPGDYSGVPASVTFNNGDTSESFTFTATDDTVDDDGESVLLTFGTPLPTRVSAGTPTETTVTINDDDAAAAAATGAPLVRGERKVGATLTGDTQGITDGDGLTNPGFNYQWQRMENGTPEDIPGAVSETYTLTDDDVGKRVRLQVRFNDDEGTAEMRTGPTTSIITPNPRILVSNASRSSNTATTRDYSSAFITGPHPLGYTIDTITMPRSNLTSAPSAQGEYRLYSSVGTSDPIFAYPNDLLMTASPPDEVNGLVLAFSAPSRVKLRPNTPYQNVLTSKTSQSMGCNLSAQGVDAISLAGFSITPRSHQFGTPINTLSNACLFKIRGFELTTSSFVKKVEFTSTPTSEGMYVTGGTIEVTAELTETVTFTEPPLMLLQVGDNEREMTYVASRSTGTSWVFQYTVTAIDRDDDGVSLESNALRGYADADLSHRGGSGGDQIHPVNAAPQVSSHRVSSSPAVPPWYGPGEQIQFTVEFTLPVTVVGDPQLEFRITTPGPQNEFASYLSGSGTTELVFSYTVLAVDDDADGIYWEDDTIRLDSDDSITGIVNGLDADLDHTELGKLEDHRIDQNPRAVSQEVTSDPVGGTSSDTYGAGDAITFEVVFNQPVTVNGAPRLRFSISSGTVDEYATYVSGLSSNTLVFSYTVLAADADTDGIYLYTDPLDYPDSVADSIVGFSNNLPAVNAGIGKEGTLSGHKVDGSLTN